MKYQVIISDRAKEMLGQHVHFLANINKTAAIKLKARIIETISSLKEMPERYPFFNEKYIPPNKYHKLYIEKWYLVLYQIRDNIVYVDWIVDTRQDYQWLIK